ncbi:GNAT family N-acetyltransferase [Ideonella sp. BN130291]|uniref:GNAT family N-acetyltransferase n=1 Tax=Ideonella sp. BN130291 TaxID=3112940 RepID=UPI002E264920|nr:GNAT family N-acetyltransferase [Ideonella sp. BN130291]
MGFPGDFLQRALPAEHPSADTAEAPAAPAFRWIPIRSLAARHRTRILTHLLSLNESDRYLRFGYAASDEQITRYVDLIDFERDEVFGVFNRRLQLIAMAHLAYPDTAEASLAEFGVSVLGKARGRGYGARLFDHAVLHARNRGVDTLVIHALSENLAMLRIARNAGARILREGAESQAVVKLPPEDMASRVGELVEDRAAELDYQLKVQARRMDALLLAMAEVKQQLGRTGRSSES